MGGAWKKRIKNEQKEQRSNHFLSFTKTIRTWHLILVLIPMLFLTATFLRFDHIKMNELKDAVLLADAAGENSDGEVISGEPQKTQQEITEDITNKLKVLRDFVNSHTIVNFVENNGSTYLTFGTGPFYLEHQYNRLATKALAEAQVIAAQYSDANPNGNVYDYANKVCRPQAIRNGWSWNSAAYISCMTGEIAKYPTSDYITELIVAKIPSTALFRYDFVSPIWSLSLSGVTMLISIVLIIVIIIRILSWIILNLALKLVK